ncbi:hypothetical protein GCM10007907_40230 [Chitinimonas prasina]|uniref:SCP domain-containing protein n=1 Tax=Chitinimonas prasina TaxID=1434937 RepID=A0ABQ5YNH4_9NEIS|nr:CAP domain-containing protein [Chitinimonas prasina]GLR15233.1 hypothetical protein GCM10007907_40230 [Chitinimonas prasina]
MLATVLLLSTANAATIAVQPAPADYPAPRFPASIAEMEHTVRIQSAQAGTGYSVDPTSRAMSRLFYRTVFSSSNGVPSGWNGNLAACNAGDTTADFKGAILRRINWFRAMSGIPAAVSFDPSFNAKAQQAALMMAANKSLSHSPPTNWLCYTSGGADAAGNGNIALGNFGPGAIANGYISDGGGNNAAVGHRRWILYPQTQFMGTGDVDGSIAGTSSNTLWVFDGNMWGARPAVRDDFVAWPPKGYVPYTTVYPRWSFSYPKADFSTATVTMTQNGSAMGPVKLEPVANGYGDNTLVWFPAGTRDGVNLPKPTADTTYNVTIGNVKVGGATRTFNYAVTVYDPDVAGTGDITPVPTGSASPFVGQATPYQFEAVPGATAYQWRPISLTPFSLNDGAESGSGNFSLSTSAGYNVVQGDLVASGAASFHLAHLKATDQTMTLTQPFYIERGASLSFASRLGLATSDQHAKVELSLDDGASWTAVYQQAGNGKAESSFTVRDISLAQYAGRTAQLRFRYAFSVGSFYPQASKGTGWYLDNIALSGVAASSPGSPATVASNAFNYTPPTIGKALLQVRPGMYNTFGDWGPGLEVAAVGGTKPTPSEAERLMNWAERTYPQYFSPAATSQQIDIYTARAYAKGYYLGLANGIVYVYGPDFGPDILAVGPASSFLATCGC